MFRTATSLLTAVADVLDDMLAADFEFEDEYSSGTELPTWDASPAAGGCDAEFRRHNSSLGHLVPARRAGAVDPPAEHCDSPVARLRDR